jgi:hypothetical protein
MQVQSIALCVTCAVQDLAPRLVVRPETRLDALLGSEAFDALVYNLNFRLDLQLKVTDVINTQTVQGLIDHVTTQREEKYA